MYPTELIQQCMKNFVLFYLLTGLVVRRNFFGYTRGKSKIYRKVYAVRCLKLTKSIATVIGILTCCFVQNRISPLSSIILRPSHSPVFVCGRTKRLGGLNFQLIVSTVNALCK